MPVCQFLVKFYAALIVYAVLIPYSSGRFSEIQFCQVVQEQRKCVPTMANCARCCLPELKYFGLDLNLIWFFLVYGCFDLWEGNQLAIALRSRNLFLLAYCGSHK
ncbi:hypothetical protein Droror1_Dr00016220 [Drosera rotundifolia]